MLIKKRKTSWRLSSGKDWTASQWLCLRLRRKENPYQVFFYQNYPFKVKYTPESSTRLNVVHVCTNELKFGLNCIKTYPKNVRMKRIFVLKKNTRKDKKRGKYYINNNKKASPLFSSFSPLSCTYIGNWAAVLVSLTVKSQTAVVGF